MEKVKWGVLGTANIARMATLPGFLKADNCEVIAIAGRNSDKVREYQAQFGIKKGYLSYDSLLDDEEIEAVYIPLANQLHYEWVKKCADSGKHILCEKPLAESEEKVKELIEYCDKKGVLLMEAFAYVHSTLIKRVMEILASGEIGEPHTVTTEFYGLRHPMTNVRMRKETLGGTIFDLVCYNTDFTLSVFKKEPVDVKAIATKNINGVDDTSAVIMDFGNGKKALSTCGYTMDKPYRELNSNIYCTKGAILIKDSYNNSGKISFSVKTDNAVRIETLDVSDNYMLEVKQFSSCIRGNDTILYTHERSVENSRLLDRILKEIDY